MFFPTNPSIVDWASLPLYTYTQLSEPDLDIRVVEILPGKGDDEICIRLKHTQVVTQSNTSEQGGTKDLPDELDSGWGVAKTLDGRLIFVNPDSGKLQWDPPDVEFDPSIYKKDSLVEAQPEFEALSYTWGTEPPSKFLIIEGTTRTKFAVRPNLLGALKHFRYPEKTRTLWIDAICINQTDDVEKSVQVARIADVYRLAHQVIVWLGPEAADSKLALSALRKIGQQFVATTNGYVLPSPDATNPEWCHGMTAIPFEKKTWVAINSLLERPWFERLWVVQEVQLGGSRSIVQCGEDTIPFTLFRGGVNCIFYKRPPPPGISKVAVRWANRLVSPWDKFTFFKVASAAQSRQCFDPRDKIYGIRSLLPKGLAAEIKPDYTKDAGEAFKNVFLAHAGYVKRFELFSQCTSADRKIQTPSWVPDWTGSYSDATEVQDQFATGCSQAEFSFTPPNILTATGLQCGVVSEALAPVPKKATDAEKIRIIRSWQPTDLNTGVYINGERLKMVHAKLLFFNRMKERVPTPFVPTEDEWAAQEWDFPLFGDNLVDVADSLQIPLKWRDGLRSVKRCIGRRYIKTVEGHIGLAPHDTQLSKFRNNPVSVSILLTYASRRCGRGSSWRPLSSDPPSYYLGTVQISG